MDLVYKIAVFDKIYSSTVQYTQNHSVTNVHVSLDVLNIILFLMPRFILQDFDKLFFLQSYLCMVE